MKEICISILLLFTPILSTRVAGAEDVSRRRLQASDWRIRKAAFFEIKEDSSPLARKELISLLSRENAVTAEAYRSGVGAEGKYGEDYVSYKDDLTEFVADAYKKFKDKEALPVLLHSAYNPDSVFAKWLGSLGGEVLPITKQMLGSDFDPDRENAVAVVAHLLSAERDSKVKLSTADTDEAHRQLLQAAANTDAYTRQVAARYLGQVGSERDIPFLRTLARDDPGFDKQHSSYPVRDAAVEAIKKLQRSVHEDPMH